MNSPRVLTLLAAGTAALALVGACGSTDGSGGSGAAEPSTGKTVSAQSTSLGTILVDSRGRTVYVFANDKPGESTCDGACAANWPPVTAPSQLATSLPGVTGRLGAITRSDGNHQVTVAGHPIYTFSGDTSAGQTNGQGVTLNGGLWTVVLPSGAPDTNAASGTSSSPLPGY